MGDLSHQAPPPPRELNWLIECLGLEDTVKVIEISGGLQVWVPSGVGASWDSKREEFDAGFGEALAQQLVRYYGGGMIKIPLAAKWRTKFYYSQGMKHAQIARKLQCSVETVQRRLSGYNEQNSSFTANRRGMSQKDERGYRARKST
jgi:hypothetical protein